MSSHDVWIWGYIFGEWVGLAVAAYALNPKRQITPWHVVAAFTISTVVMYATAAVVAVLEGR